MVRAAIELCRLQSTWSSSRPWTGLSTLRLTSPPLCRHGSDASAYPIFEGHTIQSYHNYSLFDPTRWPRDKIYPAFRKACDGNCILCMQDHCSCQFAPLAGTLIELVQYPNKKRGIRSLSNFKKGDILDQSALEYCPFVDKGDANKPAVMTGGTDWNSDPFALVLLQRHRK